MRNRPVLLLVVIDVIAAGLGIALGLTINWFPGQASVQADKVDTLYKVLIVATVPIFVLVQSIVLFSVWKFRMRPGEEEKDGPPIHGNTRLEVIWTAVPALLIISLVSYAYTVLRDFERKPAGREMDVDVSSQQFAWSFSYPRSVTGGQPVNADILYLPEGRPIQFHVRSKDVIHAFYVPSMRLQIDAVPGQTSDVRATPNKLGTFPLVCAELCGLGHAAMRATVKVVSSTAFESWLRSQSSPGGSQSPPGGAPSKSAPAAASPHRTARGGPHPRRPA